MAVQLGHALVRSVTLPFGVRLHGVNGSPLSGPSGTKVNAGGVGTTVFDKSTGLVFTNEGTDQSPYWSPTSFDQARLQGFWTDFRDGIGKSHFDTDISKLLAGGIRVHGNGIDERNAGLDVTWTDRGPIGRLTTTNKRGCVAALSIGSDALPFRPDSHGPLVVECEFANVKRRSDRATFLGFIGSSTAALSARVTGSLSTITLVDDDLAGLFQDSSLTNVDGVFFASTKDNANNMQSTNGRETDESTASVGVYQTWRVEVSRNGDVRAFVNRQQVFHEAGALNPVNSIMPVFMLESSPMACQSVDVARFAAWGQRP